MIFTILYRDKCHFLCFGMLLWVGTEEKTTKHCIFYFLLSYPEAYVISD